MLSVLEQLGLSLKNKKQSTPKPDVIPETAKSTTTTPTTTKTSSAKVNQFQLLINLSKKTNYHYRKPHRNQ